MTTETPLYVYTCNQPAACPGRGGQLTGWLVDLLVSDALIRYARNPSRLKARHRQALTTPNNADRSRHRRQIEDQARELKEREDRLLDAVERGLLPDAVVRKRLKDIQTAQKGLRSQKEPRGSSSIPSLPDLERILVLAKGIAHASKTAQRELLEHLAHSVQIDPRKRLLGISWRLGGECRYQVPQFRGGPGRGASQTVA